jgi:hypothetical protein
MTIFMLGDHMAEKSAHGILNPNDLWNQYDSIGRWQAVPGGTGITLAGVQAVGMAAPTQRGTPANADDAFGPYIAYPTTTTNNNVAGVNSASPALYRATWLPNVGFTGKFGSLITNYRLWIGLFSADPSGSATAPAHTAGFRFDTGAGDATIKAVTKDATTATILETGVLPLPDDRFSLGIELQGVVGTAPERCNFYVNRVLATTTTLTLPVSATTNLAFYCALTNLSAASHTIRVGRVSIATQG